MVRGEDDRLNQSAGNQVAPFRPRVPSVKPAAGIATRCDLGRPAGPVEARERQASYRLDVGGS